MSKTVLQFATLFVGMLLAQLICNRICLFGVAVPIVFIYFIIRLPMNLSVNWVMCLSFMLGLFVDIFENTQGMNALSANCVAVFLIQSFSLGHIGITFLRIISSSILTVLILLGFDSIATTRRREKRL